MFAAVSFGCFRAVALHAFNPLSPKLNGYLILPGTLHGRIVGLAVPDQRTHQVLFIVFPAALHDCSRKQVLPLKHVAVLLSGILIRRFHAR